LAEDLEEKGLRVMFDDRPDASAGVKFKDAELIGIPFIVIVGKALSEGKVEFRVRRTGEKSEIELLKAVTEITSRVLNS
jgi:prolyl-tRNA synthetase